MRYPLSIRASPCVFGYGRDLEEFRPVFASDEEAVRRGIVGDAVQNIDQGATIHVWQKPGQVDPAEDGAGGGIDTDNLVRLPDIRVDLAVDVFEFIEVGQRNAVVRDADRPYDGEGLRIEE